MASSLTQHASALQHQTMAPSNYAENNGTHYIPLPLDLTSSDRGRSFQNPTSMYKSYCTGSISESNSSTCPSTLIFNVPSLDCELMNSLLSIGRPSLLHLPIIPGIYQVPGKGGAGRNLSIDGLSPSNNNISTVNLQNGESYNQQENKSSSHIIGHLGDSKFTDSVIKANKALIGEATSENGNNGIPFLICSSTTTTSDSDGSGSSRSSCKNGTGNCQILISDECPRPHDNSAERGKRRICKAAFNGKSKKYGGGNNGVLRNHSRHKQIVRDEAYLERRRKNNVAAKRSRDSRRKKEDEVAVRVVILEQENSRLKQEIGRLRAEVEGQRIVAFNLSHSNFKNKAFMQHQGQTLPSSLALALAAATAATGGISSGEEKPEAYRDPNK